LLQRVNHFRSADKPAADGAPGENPASIAAGVRKTSEHAALAAQISKLDVERQAVVDEMRVLISSNCGEMNDAQIRRLQKRRLEIEPALTEMRIACRPLREAHAARIAEALATSMRDRAVTVLRLLDELSRTAAYLNECFDQIERAAGELTPERFRQDYGAVEFLARRVAGLLEDGS
jgi:hypothetical protein